MTDFLIGLGLLLFLFCLFMLPVAFTVEIFNRWKDAQQRRQREAALLDEMSGQG